MPSLHPKLLHVPRHQRDRMVGATLADNLREQYGRRNVRVIKGDSVRVMRGEYKGVEGKVERVDTKDGTLEIEGIQRDKVRGGQVKVPIHSSNVMITGLKMDDKYRSTTLTTQKEAKPSPEPKTEAEEKPAKRVKAKKAKKAAKKTTKAKSTKGRKK